MNRYGLYLPVHRRRYSKVAATILAGGWEPNNQLNLLFYKDNKDETGVGFERGLQRFEYVDMREVRSALY